MKIWSDTFNAETALEHSFYNKTEEAEKEFKEIMEAIRSVVEDRTTDSTLVRVKISNICKINVKHLINLGYTVQQETGRTLIKW